MPDPIYCPLCEGHELKHEDANGKFLGLASAPECDVEGPYFPDTLPGHVVYCEDCGEVTPVEVFDFIYPDEYAHPF